ncbi:hypothetical protein BDN70DRAFT_629481 [Pholiota conissans]|uniref:Uncharacterized protein n=1 Tax=Pholiota conissans TaxID=109636 RepID=A0A9P6CZJ7_9AGAR|nr:hypothetical protein BDN70DRAFT_629481 [Pholiota conissans]
MAGTAIAMKQPRLSRTPPPPAAPYHARSSSQSTFTALSNSMHWLSRSASPPASAPAYIPSKPVKIAEPKRVRTIDSISPPSRTAGTLGAGAVVVRTPDEALRETGVRLVPEPLNISSPSAPADKKDKVKGPSSRHSAEANLGPGGANLESPLTPTSPPLPPLPTLDADDEKTLAEPESPGQRSPPRPIRPPPPAPASVSRPPSLRSSLKVRTTSTVEDAPDVPPIPANIAAFNQPPPFSAILLSDPPSMAMDTAKTIITIETCTETFKTTLNTLKSRPSFLAKYLSALCFHPHHESMTSIYSSESDDLSTYRRHLTSQGLLPHSSNIHVFLDRASSP